MIKLISIQAIVIENENQNVWAKKKEKRILNFDLVKNDSSKQMLQSIQITESKFSNGARSINANVIYFEIVNLFMALHVISDFENVPFVHTHARIHTEVHTSQFISRKWSFWVYYCH